MLHSRVPQFSVISFARSAVISILAMFAYADRSFADFMIGYAADYGVIYETTTPQTFAPSGSSIYGDVGLAVDGQLAGTGTSIVGNVDFSAAYNGIPNQQYNGSGLTVSPSPYDPDGTAPQYNVFKLQNDVLNGNSAVNSVNSLSYTLGMETGASIKFGNNAGETLSINAVAGDNLYTVTSLADFTSGDTLTITGTRASFVEINIPASAASTGGLDGNITLVGIPSDQVVFNFTPNVGDPNYNSDYATLTGGPTMTIDGASRTAGIFLDPTGNFSVSDSTIDGRIIGSGDSTLESSLVFAPEPSSLVLAALGLLALVGCRRVARKPQGNLA